MAHQKITSPTASQKSKVVQVRTTTRDTPTTDQIGQRAYEIFLSRGAEHGHDQEDWFQAEQELRLGRQ